MKLNNTVKTVLILLSGQSIVATLPRQGLAQTKNLIVRGTVICLPEGKREYERPLNGECLIVVPNDFPNSAEFPDNDGVFHIILPWRFIDKNLTLECRCRNTPVGSMNIFIAEDHLRTEGKNKVFKIENSLVLAKACGFLHFNLDSCMAERNQYRKSDSTKLFRKASITAIIGVGALAGALILQGDRGTLPPSDTTFIDTLQIKKTIFPKTDLAKLTARLFLEHGPFNGTNFAPRHNFERALFLNPSSLIFSNFRSISVRTEITELLKFWQGNGFVSISPNVGIGGGLVFAQQKEKTLVNLTPETTHAGLIPAKEILGLVALALKINEKSSLGFSAQYLTQKIEIPIDVVKFHTGDINAPSTIFRTAKKKASHVDFNLSATINPSQTIRVGANLSNIAGKKLITQDGLFVSTRSLGLGISYKKRHVIAGTDVLISARNKTDLAFGLNYILSNHLDLNSSFITRYSSFQAGTVLKFSLFKLNYSFNHNGLYNDSHLLGISLIL